jgi:RNA polymerase sigma factor (sigma-70 family)
MEVLGRSEPLLRRQAQRHAERVDDIDDALQSAYTLFLQHYAGIGEPLAWLHTTVKREAWALRRKAARQRETSFYVETDPSGGQFDLTESLPSDTPEPEELLERSESLAEDQRALRGLKPDERRALFLLGLGLSYAEICQRTGWTYTKVNRCLSEGRATLRAAR